MTSEAYPMRGYHRWWGFYQLFSTVDHHGPPGSPLGSVTTWECLWEVSMATYGRFVGYHWDISLIDFGYFFVACNDEVALDLFGHDARTFWGDPTRVMGTNYHLKLIVGIDQFWHIPLIDGPPMFQSGWNHVHLLMEQSDYGHPTLWSSMNLFGESMSESHILVVEHIC